MKKIFQWQGNILACSITGGLNEQTIILLQPGIGDSSYYSELILSLKPSFKVIAIDFPGVGKSHFTHSNTIKGIAEMVIELLKTLGIQSPVVIGISYGGSVAVEMSSRLQFKKLVLCFSGEYWGFIKRVLYSLFFIPPLISSRLRLFIARMLIQGDHFDFRVFSDSQLKQLCQRWVDVLWYSLPYLLPSQTSVFILCSITDDVVRSDSLLKIITMFPKHQIMDVAGSHSFCIELLRKDHFVLLQTLRSQSL